MTEIPRIFDFELLRQRRVRAYRRHGNAADFLLKEATTDMMGRLSLVLRAFPTCIELGGHSGLLADSLSKRKGTDRIIRLEQSCEFISPRHEAFILEEERLPLDCQGANLLVSPLFLHWINDLPGMLVQIRHALVADGLFLATLLGQESLHELRTSLLQADIETIGGATPHVAPFPELKDMGSLLQRAGFALPVVDQDRITVRYDSMFDLMQDLRKMGATNILYERSRKVMRRETLFRAASIYGERFSDPDGRIRATFQILSLSGWAPHESQQQPLKPGSAKAPLSSALGDKSETDATH